MTTGPEDNTMTHMANLSQPKRGRGRQRQISDEDLSLINQCAAEYFKLKREADQMCPRGIAQKFGLARSTVQKIYAAAMDLEEHTK